MNTTLVQEDIEEGNHDYRMQNKHKGALSCLHIITQEKNIRKSTSHSIKERLDKSFYAVSIIKNLCFCRAGLSSNRSKVIPEIKIKKQNSLSVTTSIFFYFCILQYPKMVLIRTEKFRYTLYLIPG